MPGEGVPASLGPGLRTVNRAIRTARWMTEIEEELDDRYDGPGLSG